MEGIEPGPRLELLAAFRAELGSWLSANTLNRLKDLLRLRDDESLNAEKKLALALRGWLLDGGGTDDMATATSLWTARGLTLEYLNSTENAERQRIVSMLRSEQAGTPQSIARFAGGDAATPRTTRGGGGCPVHRRTTSGHRTVRQRLVSWTSRYLRRGDEAGRDV